MASNVVAKDRGEITHWSNGDMSNGNMSADPPLTCRQAQRRDMPYQLIALA